MFMIPVLIVAAGLGFLVWRRSAKDVEAEAPLRSPRSPQVPPQLKALAKRVADNVRQHGEGYDVNTMHAFQAAVGIRPNVDEIGYGPMTRAAIVQIGIANAPRPLPSSQPGPG